MIGWGLYAVAVGGIIGVFATAILLRQHEIEDWSEGRMGRPPLSTPQSVILKHEESDAKRFLRAIQVAGEMRFACDPSLWSG